MKQQKHKRKESFSFLLVSNLGNDTRQFYVSVAVLRLIIVLMSLICLTFVWSIFRSGTHYKNESELRRKLAASEQTVKQLETEKETLMAQNAALSEENELFRQVETIKEKVAETEDKNEDETPNDTAIPSQYPCTTGGVLKEQYSDEHPYFSISVPSENSIIAAGDGVVTLVDADDGHLHIIEVDHGNGYRTRYMCQQEADVQVEIGQQVQIRDVLMAVHTDDTQLDYQVIYEDRAIDPLLVLEAKG